MSRTAIEATVIVAVAIGLLFFAHERHQEHAVKADARDRAARKKAEQAEEERRELIRRYGIDAVGVMELQPVILEALPFNQEAEAQAERRSECLRRLDSVRRQIFRDGEWSVGFVVVVTALTMAWVTFFVLQRFLDIQIMQDVGYHATLAAALGTVIALGVSVLGIVISGLLGLHPLLPAVDRMRRSMRITLALLLLIPLLGLVFALPPIAIYRSESTLGAQVTQLEKELVAAQSAVPVDPLEVAAIQKDLAAAELRLSKGERLDRTIAVTVPLLELATSPAPVYFWELLVALWLASSAAVARRKEREARNTVAALAQAFQGRIMDLIVPIGMDPAEAEQLLARGGPGAASIPDTHPTLDTSVQGSEEAIPPGPPPEAPSQRPPTDWGLSPNDQQIEDTQRTGDGPQGPPDPWSLL